MVTISGNLVIIASFTNDLNSGVYDHLPLDPVDERCNEMNRRMQDIFDLYDSTSQQVSDLRDQVWAQWDELTRAIVGAAFAPGLRDLGRVGVFAVCSKWRSVAVSPDLETLRAGVDCDYHEFVVRGMADGVW